ncbi:MAG: hypothetical protein WBP49_14835 [Acidimicrobiia bacterium]
MRRSTSRTYASWIPTIFALLVSVAVIGRWVLTMDGPIRVAAVVLLGALVPIAAVAGAYASQRPLNCRVAELEAALEEEQVARRAHDEIYGRFVNELRAPLTGVYGFSRHLDDSGIANISEAEELIGIISHDATEAVRKVENIATAAQIEAGVYRPVPTAVDLGTHVGRIVEVIGRSRIKISVDSQPTVAWCDPTAVRQILVNLVHIAGEAGATSLRFDVDERNGLAVVTVTDDRIRHNPDERAAEDLLGTAGSLSNRLVPALVEYQGGTMNTQRSLGWTITMIHFPVATPAQRSEDFRSPHATSSTSSSGAPGSDRGSLPQTIPARTRRELTGRR